ncbi:hypothetical protein MKW92_006691 [Papaver armeniacum]|nr:hypothetical protein MKW92_006691 [Papaver armeniacum]
MSTSIDVRRLSTTKIRPASFTEKQTDTHKRIDLNPWDLLFIRFTYIQKGFIFTKQQAEEGTKDERSIQDKISHLKTSLSHTLDHFFPLASRLGIEKHEDGNTFSVYIDCNFEGAEFVHATANISVEDILSPTYNPQSIIYPLFPLVGVRNWEVTELTDGVFIGCSANHSVCDGTSFWQFINSWSEISTNNYTSCPCPVFDRWFIKEEDCPIRLPLSFADKLLGKAAAPPPDGLVERCFRFTKTNIAALKDKASLEIISETKETMVISSLQAILAHIWTAVVRSRSCLEENYDESREVAVALMMNNRTKVIPPLPETFFGNSVSWRIVTLKEGELIERGFGFLASLLNEVVNSHNFENSKSFVESYIQDPFIPGPGDGRGSISNIFIARSSQRFNMYGNDLGWGRPIALKTGPTGRSNGTTTVNPGPVEGSIDIDIWLPIEVFKAMENDAQFMEAFAT